MKRRSYILIDPHHDYALSFIQTIRDNHGLAPICVYTDLRAEFYGRAAYPEVRKHAVESHFLEETSPAQLCRELKTRYDILGVIPTTEKAVEPASRLAEHLGIDWNDPVVLRRFRDKHGLKSHLRVARPDLPMNDSRQVTCAQEVFAQPLPNRFVIKPNNGFANRDIGFFSATGPCRTVEEYFLRSPGGSYVLEDFLEGTEYAINGQIDAAGRAFVITVLEYERRALNGRENLYYNTHHVRQTDPAFWQLARYIVDVMEASGLRRSPFHAEVMLTPKGPRLIEVGARLGGSHHAYWANRVHGGAFDIFAWAAHHYLFATPYPEPALDWQHYNRVSYMHVDGYAERSEMVYDVGGVEEVERLPEFCAWVLQPRAGNRVHRTLDLLTVPYAFQLMSQTSRNDLARVAQHARSLITLNARTVPQKYVAAHARSLLRRSRAKGSWMLHDMLRRFTARKAS